MDPSLVLITSIIQLISKYGLPLAMDIVKTWNTSDEPTIEEIHELRNRVPRPESYFKLKHTMPVTASGDVRLGGSEYKDDEKEEDSIMDADNPFNI